MASKKSAKPITKIEVEFVGGPLAGQKQEFAYPSSAYVVMDMGRALYIKDGTTRYTYSTDWSGIEELRKQERERLKSI